MFLGSDCTQNNANGCYCLFSLGSRHDHVLCPFLAEVELGMVCSLHPYPVQACEDLLVKVVKDR